MGKKDICRICNEEDVEALHLSVRPEDVGDASHLSAGGAYSWLSWDQKVRDKNVDADQFVIATQFVGFTLVLIGASVPQPPRC